MAELDDTLDPVPPEPIVLVDYTDDLTGTIASKSHLDGSWAKNVQIVGYNVIQGRSKTGAYVTYIVHIETLGGSRIELFRRYSQFAELHDQLLKSFHSHHSEIPELPPKSYVYKFRPDFLEGRRRRLEYVLLCVMLNPLFANSSMVKQFVDG